MTKIISWNIDSINAALTSTSDRAKLSQKVLRKIASLGCDIIAVQETKLPAEGPSGKHIELLKEYLPGYDFEWVSSTPPARKGYAGTMTFFREGMKPSKDTPSIGAPDTMDSEGRILTLEFEEFFFVNVYTPNAGDELRRLPERQVWDERFADYLKKLDKKKPVICCGDMNVAHEEIDLANPASNHMSAGFTDEERAGFTNLLAKGFVDSFRFVNGQIPDVYTWWSQRIRTSKINNSGWRIDYFVVSDRIKDKIRSSSVVDSGTRQDHAPIELEIDL